MSRIKLSITIKIGQLALIRCYTDAKRKYTKFHFKVLLALSYTEYYRSGYFQNTGNDITDWVYLIVFIRVFRSSFLNGG